MKACWFLLAVSPFLASSLLVAQTKPPIALDEFLSATDISSARISPDGSAAVIATNSPDWQADRFREDLWLWTRQSGAVLAFTQSRHDSSPEWSPDGRYIAFLSDRTLANAKDSEDKDEADKDGPSRVWVVRVDGGEAFPLYREKLDCHAFAWSADSSAIEFSATDPLPKDAEDVRKKEWKDVIRWREQERGDVLLSVPIDAAVHEISVTPRDHDGPKTPEDKPAYPDDARVVTRSSLEIDTIAPSPAGDRIAFVTAPISHRLENPNDHEIFLVSANGGEAHQLTHNQALESHLTWNPSGRELYCLVPAAGGSLEGPYQDVQGRVYSLNLKSGEATRLGSDFKGSWEDLTITSDGKLLAAGLTGIDQGIYRIEGARFEQVGSVPGNYAHLDTARKGGAILFTHSTIAEPTQVFLANDLSAVNISKPATSFNPIFVQRARVEWEPYKWKSPDGTEVEGVLIYPPGKKGQKHLRMLTLIHGGPADADGNRFGADWYDWATLAAANGWLVFRPNYRGSSGYGDAFILGIMPHLVSAPGVDILTGVDALVKDGIADPDRLTIGGYSYGGYMTNWIITQTTRFKAAVTGAGAVEHAANWGNDDLTRDDAWYLSGTPWEKPELYQSEAALFQINKVTTPTHIVGGNADVRVSYLEQVLLERALQRLNVPHTLLVFPGEGHPLDKDPWHGYIKVREELKWLEKYGGGK